MPKAPLSPLDGGRHEREALLHHVAGGGSGRSLERGDYWSDRKSNATTADAEDEEILATTAMPGGHRKHDDDEWQVMGSWSCFCTRVADVVHFRHANFGLRWRNARTPSCMVGPHWFFMVSTFTVLTCMTVLVTVLTSPKAGVGELSTGILLSSACLSMYALVGCSNPGIVPRTSVPPDDTYTYCDQCESYRPEGALHCMDCRVCIEEYDHHCPWTGKCVGKGNVRYFYGWLFFLVLAFVFEVIQFTTYLMPPEDQPHVQDSEDYSEDFSVTFETASST